MKRLDNSVFTVVEGAVNDKFGGGDNYVGKLENGGVGLAPFHDYENEIPDDIKSELEAIQQGIIDGTIDTGW
jgi:basic membrane protein A